MIPHEISSEVSFVVLVLTKFTFTLDNTISIAKVGLREGWNVGPPEQALDPRRNARHCLIPTHCRQIFWYSLRNRQPYLVQPRASL